MAKRGKRARAAIDEKLKEMFDAVERWPMPDRVMSILEQLDDGEAEEEREAPLRRAKR